MTACRKAGHLQTIPGEDGQGAASGLAPASQPLQYLGRQICQPELSADMPFRQPNGRGQFLTRGELAGIHAPSPTLSLIKFQGPRTSDHGPRTLALRPSDHGPRILCLGPWFLQLGPRLSIENMLYYNNHDGGGMKFTKGNLVGLETRFGADWLGSV